MNNSASDINLENTIVIDDSGLSIDQLVAIARQQTSLRLSSSDAFIEKIDKGSQFLDRLLAEDGQIYGVTTGYGDSCTVEIPAHMVPDLPQHLYTFHGCGTGRQLSPEYSRAVLSARLTSLCQGHSGVSTGLLQQIERLFIHDIMPVIPEEGSVGASGDLTPLSYLAAVLCGEREVYYKGEIKATAEVFAELAIEPIRLRPKEGLAIMNGTAVMTGLACMAYDRARYLSKLSTRITALATIGLKGNAHHFDEVLFQVKPHPGQQQIAALLRQDLQTGEPPRNSKRLQDRYSLRCAPHVIGVLADGLPWFKQLIENELNSANDNPIIDAEGEHVLHGGHFYGGHIAMAMDSMKTAVANLADLMDRQMAQLMDTKFNHGLPANLSAAPEHRKAINHGFKALQIAVSAWTAEALKLTMPASVFSRSTECHNQDKVSMGTIAARDCLRILELTEQVASALLMSVVQAVELRLSQNDIRREHLSDGVLDTLQWVRQHSALLIEDRRLDHEINALVRSIQQQDWQPYQAS